MKNTLVSSENNFQRLKFYSSLPSRSWLFLVIGVAAGIVVILTISLLGTNLSYKYQGSLIDPPIRAPEIQINDQDGHEFTLSKQVGKVVLLFFGYTHCTDVCPVTMYQFKQIRQQMGERADQIKFVFVSVDPERDSPEVLQRYLSNFDPSLIGLSDDRSVLESVWKNFGVVQERSEESNSNDYMVDHSTRIYVIDKSGFLRMTYPFGMEIEKMIEDIDHLLSEEN